MNKQLMRCVIEAAAFLALSGEDVVHPDAAVTQLEQMATLLGELPDAERQAFIDYIEALARAESTSGSEERAAFLRALPEG